MTNLQNALVQLLFLRSFTCTIVTFIHCKTEHSFSLLADDDEDEDDEDDDTEDEDDDDETVATTSSAVLQDITSSFQPVERLEDDNDDVQTSNQAAMNLTHSSTSPIRTEAEPLSASRIAEVAELWNRRKKKNTPNLLRRLI